MKAIFLLQFLLCLSIISFGQVSIKGRVTDRYQSLPSATILLLDVDSTMVMGVVTDSTGEYSLVNVDPGDYVISVSMIGYSKFLSPRISVETANIIFPEIILEENVTELGEVVVSEMKQLYSQTPDRLVINLEGSITSSGNTVLEVLQKSPGIVVNRQDNSITMSGKSGVRVMINDKLMQVPLDVVVQMLEGMSASTVEKIELITTPPSKYDADGNAGIIHIVTKRNDDFGTSGSFGLTLGARWAETLGANISLNHRNQKFACFLDYSILRNHNLHIMKIARQSFDNEFAHVVNVHSHRENVTTQQNLSGGFEWGLNKNTTLNLGFTGYRRNWNMTALATDRNHVTIDSTLITTMNIKQSNIWQSATGAIGVQTKINSKSQIGFNLDYLFYHNDNPSMYENKLFYEQRNENEISKVDLKKDTPIRFLVASAAYEYVGSTSFTMEAGLKAVMSKFDNHVLVQRLINDTWTIDPVFTSYSNLSEQIGSAYVSKKWSPGKQWQVNSGLRYEYTHTSVSRPNHKNLVNRKYGYLFPSLSVKKSLAAEKDFQFSYSRRIARPTYNDIASYAAFWGVNTFTAENTSLRPAVSNAVKVGYHVKQWILLLQFSHVEKEITTLQPEVDYQSNNLIYRSQNLKYLNTWSLSNFYSFNLTAWWEVQSNIIAQYQVAQTTHLQNNVTLSMPAVNINMVNIVKLSKDFSIEISGMYQSSLLSGISKYLSVGSLNAGIQKKFGNNGTLKLSMDDILYTNYWRIETYLPGNNLDLYFNYDWHNQFVRVTYSRNLGKNTFRSVKLKSASEEERRRVN